MERINRKPYQGVKNIVRFNWHFYVLAMILVIILVSLSFVFAQFSFLLIFSAFFLFIPSIISLLVSYYVYDASGFYSLKWLDKLDIKNNAYIVNINAGFDETSSELVEKFRPHTFKALDFYDPEVHTEVSIKRARNAGLVYPNTITFKTNNIPLEPSSVDYAFLIFSLHEIRNGEERIEFIRSLRALLKENGKVIIVEHLRDLPNFLAYTIGFLHFYSKASWKSIFRMANINLAHAGRINPFVHIFVLE